MKSVIAGGAGTLGRSLSRSLLADGHEVVVLTRTPGRRPVPGAAEVGWDPSEIAPWAHVLESDGPIAVVNLAGKLVDCRPTEENIRELRESRVRATSALVAASQRLSRPVDRWLQGSTTGLFDDTGELRITEQTPDPVDGLPQMTGVVLPWEKASEGANAARKVTIRTSIALDAHTPALDRLLLPARLGFGGPIAGGRQWFSWIHVDDWVRIARAALGLEPGIVIPDGPVIAAAPNPVRNVELMRELRRAVHMPIGLPTPAFLMRIAAVALRTDPLLALTGRHTVSTVLAEAGFEFRFPTLRGALEDLLGTP